MKNKMINSWRFYTATKNETGGFTLVELAIVLMIIGLLIGGVLRGQELMNNARVTATIQQVKGYQGAIVTFRDVYAQLPGDMPNATTRVPGCNTGSYCVDGDGNTAIGSTVNSAVQLNQSGTSVPAVETSMFWKELALSHLISGVKSNSNPAKPAFGDTHPVAKMDGGAFVVATKTTGEPDSFASGTVLKLQESPISTGYSLSPQRASQIDRKMDDGVPNAGFVAAENVGSGCKTTDGKDGVYATATTDDTPRCVLYFAF